MKRILGLYMGIPLIIRILGGVIGGLLLGIAVPGAVFIEIFGTVFTGLLRAVAPVLVFVLVTSSLVSAARGIGRKFRTVILLYVFSTFAAGLTAVGACYVFPVKIPLESVDSFGAPSGLGEVFGTLISNGVMNPLEAIVRGNYVGILVWSVILGFAFRLRGSGRIRELLEDAASGISVAVEWIIELAPPGILGLVYGTVRESGTGIFAHYGLLLGVLAGCMLTVALVINPFIVWIALGRNPYPLVLRCLRESGITAFFTRSSAANIPVNMNLCEKLGLDRDYYSVSIPLGSTINMNGAAVTITVMSLAAAFSVGVKPDIFTAVFLSLTATLGACGASGVAGGSLLLVPMACSFLGLSQDIAMQTVSAGFVISVVQDSLETALNSSGDVLFCAVAEFRLRQKERE